MSKKQIIAFLAALPLAASVLIIPSISAAAEDAVPIVTGDVIQKEWKFNFTEEEKAGYTHVPKTAHPVMGDLETGEETGYGFVGTYDEDFNFNGAYDGLNMIKGHKTVLEENRRGITSLGSEPGTDGYDYPIRFSMYCDTGSYFRVSVTVTNYDNGNAGDVTVYSERKHVVASHETINEGEEKTYEFSVDVEPIYFKNSGEFTDDMLNIAVAGTNTAVKEMTIQKVEPGTTLWVLGDSTVTDGGSSLPLFDLVGCTGTGSSLSKYLPKDVAVSNQGEGGLNAWDNQHFAIADARIKAGDFMFVEYGHNHKTDGVGGWLGALDKYYQSCKKAGASLIIVSPIERHYAAQYNVAENKWSPWLSGFAVAGKSYVNCMIYGGESAAAEYVKIYQEQGEAAGESYAAGILAQNSTERKITNVAFVDINTYSLGWMAGISEKGTVMGTEYTNNAALVNYYFNTGKGGGTDMTHPNDAGSEGLAQGFFLDTEQKLSDYPTLAKLLKSYDGKIPQKDSTASGRLASKPKQWILDAGWAGGAAWPDAVSMYQYPAVIRRVNFNEDGTLENVEVGLMDKSIMPTYGRGIVALYDKDGALVKTAVSKAAEDNEKGYVGWVDNSVEPGIQTLGFEGNDLNINDGYSYKVYLWGMLDGEGYPLTMKPYTDGTYSPVMFDYLLTDDKREGAECFHYYGVKQDGEFYNKNGWTIAADRNMTFTAVSKKADDEKWYGEFEGTGYIKNFLSKKMQDGIVSVCGSLNYSSGTVAVQLTDGSTNIDCLKITDGVITDNSGEVITEELNGFVSFEYTIDINRGTGKLTIGNHEGSEKKLDNYNKILADEVSPQEINAVAVSTCATTSKFALTDFTVKNLTREEPLPSYNVMGDYTEGSNAEMGSITASANGAEGTTVSLTAANNGGYRFIGWYDAPSGGNKISTSKKINVRVPDEDIKLYAEFEVHEGFYYDDNFDDYDIGEKIRATGQGEAAAVPVNMGGITLYSGQRGNGAAGNSYISINAENTNKYMHCNAGNPSNNARGVKFEFANPAELESTKSIVWEFDARLADVGMTVLTGGGEYSYQAADITSNTDWVNVKLIFDMPNKLLYLVVTDKEGNLEKVAKSDISDASTVIEGACFYDVGLGSIEFDNMRVYDLGTPGTGAEIPKQSETNVIVSYVDENNNELKPAEELSTDLYEGNSFDIENYPHSTAVKATDEADTAMFDVYLLDKKASDMTIESLGSKGTNNIKLVLKKTDGLWYDYEDFSTVTDSWGFTEGNGGNVAVENGVLKLLKNAGTNKTNSDVKELDSAIAEEKNLTVTFDWKNDVAGNTGRSSSFKLLDSVDGNIFTINAVTSKKEADHIEYTIADGTAVAIENSGVNDWYRVELSFDFEGGSVSGTITNLNSQSITEIPVTEITNEGIAKISAAYGYSVAPQQLDNIGFRKD